MNKFNLVHKNFTIPFAFAIASLASCGGGGGGEAGSPVGNSPTGNSTAERSLDDLYIDQRNELATLTKLNIEVWVNAASSYLSICPELSGEINVDTYNYDNCMIRTPLDGNLKSFELSLPNHIDNLLAIVWFYEVGKQPLVTGWQRPSEKGEAIYSIWQISETS